LSALRLAPRQVRGGLALWPLLRGASAPAAEGDAGPAAPPSPPPHIPLAEALEAGLVQLDEVSEAGSVPFVRVANQGPVPVLVLFGEELAGAKQDRVANASFLVPAEASVVLDVSCVEYGRWQRPSAGALRRFRAPGRVVSQALRRKMAAKVAVSRSRGGRFVADQLEVWDEIETRLERAAVEAPTRAYADYAQSRRRHVAQAAEGFALVPGQVGFVAALGAAVAGLEAVGRADVFARVFPALLRSYAIDAVELAGEDPGAARGHDAAPAASLDAACAAFLDALARAPAEAGRSLGLGSDLRLQGERVAGCALEWGGIVHAAGWVA
jgi:hypothetical protein